MPFCDAEDISRITAQGLKKEAVLYIVKFPELKIFSPLIF
jgi:hypothetical protein